MDASVNFYCEEINYIVPEESKVRDWLSSIIHSEGRELKTLNYVFCNDEYLHRINKEYLDHDFYTDIITFDQSENGREIEGDVFISVERVEENAHLHKVTLQNEMLRVMVHGLLHLLGMDDTNESEKIEMRKKEDSCLSLYQK